VLNCCVFGALYRPPPTHRYGRGQKGSGLDRITDEETSGAITFCDTLWQPLKNLTNLSLFYNVPFTLTCIGTLLMNFGFMVFIQHTPSRAVFIGFEHRDAYLLPTVAGVALLVGRITGGIIGNLSCTNRLLQYGGSIISGGILVIVIGNLMTFYGLAVFGAAIGFVAGKLKQFYCSVD